MAYRYELFKEDGTGEWVMLCYLGEELIHGVTGKNRDGLCDADAVF